jgi:hypothetical protein
LGPPPNCALLFKSGSRAGLVRAVDPVLLDRRARVASGLPLTSAIVNYFSYFTILTNLLLL